MLQFEIFAVRGFRVATPFTAWVCRETPRARFNGLTIGKDFKNALAKFCDLHHAVNGVAMLKQDSLFGLMHYHGNLNLPPLGVW